MIKHYHKLIYFLPVGLITGPFITNLIIILCSLLFLIDTFRKKLFRYYNNSFFLIFSIFFILINFSSLLSENFISFKYSFGYIRYGIFAIFVFYVLKNFKKFKLNFSYLILTLFSLIIFDSIFQLTFGTNIFGFDIQKYRTGLPYLTSFFDKEKILGSYMVRMFPLLFFSILILIYEQNNIKYSNFLILLIPLSFLIVILSTERVSIFIFIILLLLVYINTEKIIYKKTIFFISLTLFFLFLYLNPLLLEKFKSTLYSTGLIFPGWADHWYGPYNGEIKGKYELGLYFFSKFHHDQIIVCYKLFKENILFGIGAKNFKHLAETAWHPHNYHAQILAELGLFAYLLILFLSISLIYKTFNYLFEKKKNYIQNIKFVFLISFLMFLIPIPSSDFFNNWVNSIFYFTIGFFLYLNEKKL